MKKGVIQSWQKGFTDSLNEWGANLDHDWKDSLSETLTHRMRELWISVMTERIHWLTERMRFNSQSWLNHDQSKFTDLNNESQKKSGMTRSWLKGFTDSHRIAEWERTDSQSCSKLFSDSLNNREVTRSWTKDSPIHWIKKDKISEIHWLRRWITYTRANSQSSQIEKVLQLFNLPVLLVLLMLFRCF